MADPLQPERRRFQFTLRTLLVVVAVGGVLGGWVGSGLREQWRQQAAAGELEKVGGVCWWDGRPQWLEKVLGRYCFQSVISVRFKSTQVTDAGLEHLQGLGQLEVLYLDGTKITDAGLAHLSGLSQLAHLALDNTKVTDAGLKYLAGLSRLTYLQLSGTKVSEEGASALKTLLPSCYISSAELAQLQSDRIFAEGYLKSGVSSAAASNYDEAIAEISKALKTLPDFPEAYRARGDAYSQKGDKAAAERDCKKAEALEQEKRERLAVLDGMGAQPERRRFQSSPWAWLLLAGVAAVPCGWLVVKVRQGERQRAAAAAIVRAGGGVGWNEPRGPHWLRALLGDGILDSDCYVLLNGQQVTDAALEHLKGLRRLQRLCVDGTQVTDAGLTHLRRLKHLQWLWLVRTRITDAGLEHLNGSGQLVGLWLNGSPITDAGLEHLMRLDGLQWLGLEGTQVSAAGVKRLRQALRYCEISH